MTSKEPWEAYPSLWKNQTAFFTYLRGAIRSVWSRYPPKHVWKNKQLVEPPKGYTGRAKKLGKCHHCGEFHAASKLEVDHLQQAGSCNSWETSVEFLYKLLDCNDNWALVCKPCHKIKSYAERMGISFEEARVQKKTIEFVKQNKQTVVDFCQKHGYSEGSLSTATKRRAAVETIFRKELECLSK